MGSRALVALAAVALCAGCTGVPSEGPVRVVRHVPAAAPEPPEPRLLQHVATDPEPNAVPDGIVRGYLTAQADARNDHGIARKYLAPRVPWNPGARVTVYGAVRIGKPAIRNDTATVAASLTRIGVISARGEFRPTPATVPVTFRLQRVAAAGWRLSEAPAGVLLTRDEIGVGYLRTTLYWPDQARRLVPDPVFLPSTDQPVATAVRALLAGPSGWVGPAVRNAIPQGTRLLDPPTVVDGVATLNLSREVTGAPQETVGALVAQLVWTLTEPAVGVDAVRVYAEGDPLVVPGRPGLRDHRRTDWAEYAPVPTTSDPRLFFVKSGVAQAIDDAGHPSRVGGATDPVETLAVNRSGTVLAAVTKPRVGRRSLVLVDLTGADPPRTVFTADRITAPTWEPSGDYVWVAQTSAGTQQVLAIPASSSGAPTTVTSALPAAVTSLRLSPDGARAALVAGSGSAARLWLARVERPASGGRVLADPRQAAPGLGGVTAVAFDGAAQLLAGTYVRGRVGLYRLDLDGYNLLALRTEGLPAAALAALTVSGGTAAGVPVDRVASAAGRLWRRTPGAAWSPIPERGSAGTYPG